LSLSYIVNFQRVREPGTKFLRDLHARNPKTFESHGVKFTWKTFLAYLPMFVIGQSVAQICKIQVTWA